MKGLTRYEVTGGDGPADAYEASDGEWVLFSDVERLLSPAPAAVPDDVALDAARWRLVRERGSYWAGPYAAWIVRLPYAETFEHAVDTLLAAAQKDSRHD